MVQADRELGDGKKKEEPVQHLTETSCCGGYAVSVSTQAGLQVHVCSHCGHDVTEAASYVFNHAVWTLYTRQGTNG